MDEGKEKNIYRHLIVWALIFSAFGLGGMWFIKLHIMYLFWILPMIFIGFFRKYTLSKSVNYGGVIATFFLLLSILLDFIFKSDLVLDAVIGGLVSLVLSLFLRVFAKKSKRYFKSLTNGILLYPFIFFVIEILFWISEKFRIDIDFALGVTLFAMIFGLLSYYLINTKDRSK